MNTTCANCNDSGKIVHDYASGFSTELCQCRRALPRRDGKAAYWVYDAAVVNEWHSACDWMMFGVSFRHELPVSEDNYPLRRTASNCYMGPSITLDIEGDSVLTIQDLRDLAAFLVKCADEADARETPAEQQRQ